MRIIKLIYCVCVCVYVCVCVCVCVCVRVCVCVCVWKYKKPTHTTGIRMVPYSYACNTTQSVKAMRTLIIEHKNKGKRNALNPKFKKKLSLLDIFLHNNTCDQGYRLTKKSGNNNYLGMEKFICLLYLKLT